MGGNDYYQMLHAHSLVEVAVMSFLWEAFEDWLINESDEDISYLSEFAIGLSHFCEIMSSKIEVIKTDAIEDSLEKVLKIYDKFLEQCTSPNCKLWLMYLEMIDFVKKYIYAERASTWSSQSYHSRRDASISNFSWT